MIDNRGGAVGLGLNLCPNWINFFIGTDVLITKHTPQFVPVRQSIMNVTLGIGVLCSAGFVLVFQGAIVLLAQVLAPVLSDAAIAELTCCGSVMIVAISLNMLGLTKIKTADLLPALLFVPLFTWLFSYLPL